jgi:hypothetical protein
LIFVAARIREQQIGKDKFVLRVGNQIAAQFTDFFRYKDGRTPFTSSPYTAAAASSWLVRSNGTDSWVLVVDPMTRPKVGVVA